MAEYINPLLQTVAVGNNVAFTDAIVDDCPLISHRTGSGSVKLYPAPNKCYTKFFVAFSGNIAIPTGQAVGPIELSISIDGEPSTATTMIVTPAAVEEFGNVAGFAYIYVKRCCTNVSVTNTSTIPINVQNANLIVKKA